MRIFSGIYSKTEKNAVEELLKTFPNNMKVLKLYVSTGDLLKRLNAKTKKELLDQNSLTAFALCSRKPGISKYIYQNISNNKHYIIYGKTYPTDFPKVNFKNLNTLNGDYILLMQKHNDLILAKDMIGIKQLYYGENSDLIGFSTIKKQLIFLDMVPNRLLPGEKLKITKQGIIKIGRNDIKIQKPKVFDELKAIKLYKKAIINSVKERIKNEEKIGVLLSGGVDSTIIAKIVNDLNKNLICYTAGLPLSNDIIFSKDIAKALDLNIKFYKLNPRKIKHLIPELIDTIETWDQFQVENAIPIYCAMNLATKDNVDVILNGQGADELFAGYDWYPKILGYDGKKKTNEQMWKDLQLSYKESFEMQNKLAEFYDLVLCVPYCDRNVIQTAMNIPINLKTINNDEMRKYIHRKLGEELNVPLSSTWREKESAYQSSGVHKIIKLLAQKLGYLENIKYKIQTDFEKLGNIYRYNNKYLPEHEKFGNSFVQSYFEDIAQEIGFVEFTNQ